MVPDIKFLTKNFKYIFDKKLITIYQIENKYDKGFHSDTIGVFENWDN